MAEVRQFQFPSFDDWYQNDCQWKGKIGSHYCEVHATCWGHDETWYGCAIATYDVPLNVYVDPVARYNFTWDHKNLDDLRAGYEKAISEVNARWVKYIQEQYLA